MRRRHATPWVGPASLAAITVGTEIVSRDCVPPQPPSLGRHLCTIFGWDQSAAGLHRHIAW